MLHIRVDRFALGALAEETGVPIISRPDPFDRETHTLLTLDLIAGSKGRVRFGSVVAKSTAVLPPEFTEYSWFHDATKGFKEVAK